MEAGVADSALRAAPRWKPAVTWIDLAMLVVTFIWGVNFTVVKQTLQEMSPLVFVTLRCLLASLLICAVLLIRGEDLRWERSDFWRLLALGLVGNALYQILFIEGIAHTTASNSSLLLATSPIWVTLLSALLRQDRITPTVAAGVGLSFAGIILIVGMEGSGVSLAGASLPGNVLSLAAGFCWASYTLMCRPLLRRYSPLKLTGLAMMTGTIPMLLYSADAFVQQNWTGISWQGWLGYGYSTLLAIAVAYVVWNTSVQRVGNARTAVFSTMTPVIAVVVSWLFLHEELGVWQGLGGVITLTGVALTRLAPQPLLLADNETSLSPPCQEAE
jgi:drug/metabolite transporter (DMT)-like permease